MTKYELGFLPDYSDEALLAEVRRVAELVGKPVLSKADFARHGKVGLTTLRRRIGDWQHTLARAGIGQMYSGQPVSDRMRMCGTRDLSDDEVLSLIRQTSAASGGGALAVTAFAEVTGVDRGTIIRRFGSWKNAVVRAGLRECAHGRRYSDEECFANIADLWTHYGHSPRYAELSKTPSAVGPKAYVVRWGAWRKALAAFVEWANGDDTADDMPCDAVGSDEPSEPTAVQVQHPSIPSSDRREIPLRLRFRVLQRDRFTCVACGRSPAKQMDVELHADHIVPFSKGGKTVMENLRSLCKECNLGKGDMMPQ